MAEQGLLDGAQPQPGAAAEIRDGESATRAGAKASLPVDEPRRAGARDQDGPSWPSKAPRQAPKASEVSFTRANGKGMVSMAW